ncbi:MAG: dTMP kinase [bacterium]|nr:dTMP kinase [bacterium]
MSPNLFIVIEGVDGSGKSTVAKIVAEKLGAQVIETPQGWWRKYRYLVENSHPTIRFLYYTVANHFSSISIRSILKRNSVVCSRFIHSTKAHHIVYGCKLAYWLPLNMLANKKPDLVYYLYVNQVERERRINQRATNTEKDRESKTLKKVHRIFCKLPGLTRIDTSGISEQEVANIICDDIDSKTAR